MPALDAIADWPVPAAAAAVVGPSGVLAEHGDTAHRFALASVTKPLVARAVQIAIEEGVVELDTAAGPPGSTMRHLLAHAVRVLDALGRNDVAAGQAPGVLQLRLCGGGRNGGAGSSGIEFGRYLAEAVFEPLGMSSSELEGGAEAAGYGATSTVADLAVFAATCCGPRWCRARCTPRPPRAVPRAWTACLPGFGVQRPNDWGLGFEIRDAKSPHWTGSANSGRTYGHFGQSGTFIWVDPERDLALVVLTDRNFGDWAYAPWPALSDAVIDEFGSK